VPIRTHRGRAAVYRRLWGWPLRSPKHLTTAVVVLVVLITAIGIVVPKLVARGNGPATGPGAPGALPSRTTGNYPAPDYPSTSLPTRLSAPLKSPTSAPPNSDALRVAKAWATAWVNHPPGTTNAQWLDGLRPYTTDEYLPQMSTVDPANIPATKVTGEPATTQSYTSSMDVQISTDGPKLAITVVSTAAGWRVARYDQAG
jgi:hypothetical protein